MRTLATLIVVVLLLLVGCRSESERAAMARAPDLESMPAAGSVEGDAGPDAPDARLRRLWSGSDFNFYASSPSPDGRWVTEIDWSTGDLAVRDLMDGRLHRLTAKGSWEESRDYAEVSMFSPDGQRVVYVWFVPETREHEVRVLDFELDEAGVPRGSGLRIAHAGSPLLLYWIYGWTSDDEILAGIYRPGNTTALGLLSLSTGELRVLKSFDWHDAHATVSSDGRFIAYDHPPGPDPRDREIYLLSADGTRETLLVEGPGRDQVLGWLPGDSALLFHSERSGVPSVWRLPMADGRPTGLPQLVREDVRKLEPLGFAGQDFYFGVLVEQPAFRTATIDFTNRRLAQLPTTFEAPFDEGLNRALAWSPDGEHAVHFHDAASHSGTWVYLRTASGEVIGEWKFDFVIRANPAFASWTPDGRSVLFGGIDRQGRGGFFRIDLESGDLELVRRFEHQGYFGRPFSISPDGRSLYFTGIVGGDRVADENGVLDESTEQIVVQDLETGAERALHSVRSQGPVIPSPDGAVLAYHESFLAGGMEADPTIWLFPVDGGEPRILHRVEDPGHPVGIVGWTPDGRFLLFLVRPADSGEHELWRVSRDGHGAERIATIPDYAGGWALHPNGRTLAYRAGRYRGEIWALEGAGERGVVDRGLGR